MSLDSRLQIHSASAPVASLAKLSTHPNSQSAPSLVFRVSLSNFHFFLMTILITGICGFAGSVIARHLLEHSSGLCLVGFDNLSRKGSGTNVDPLRLLGIDVRIGDVRDRVFLDTLPKADWILDCAANPSVLGGVDGSDTRDLVDQNLYGTVNLLELCKAWKAGFVLLSTSRVYSIPPLASLPLREEPTRFEPDFQQQEGEDEAKGESAITKDGLAETFSTEPPVSLYGSTKRCSELMSLEYGAAFSFPVWINRCGVLAGAGQFGKADQGIFSYWIHSWRAGRPLKYIGFGGTGKQVRDCLHPRDLVPLLLKQFAIGNHQSAIPNITNCSGGITNSMSLLELSNWCQARFGQHSTADISASRLPPCSAGAPVAFPATQSTSPCDQKALSRGCSDFSSRPFDIPWMVLDSTLARQTWDWAPATPIHDILEEIARHAEANPGWLDLVT